RITSDQDGSPSDRPPVGGSSRGRRQGGDLDRMRIPLARDQLHAAAAFERRRPVQPAYAGQGHRLLHSRRATRTIARRPPARATRRRGLLSDIGRPLRAHGHRKRAPLAAHAGGAARERAVEGATPQRIPLRWGPAQPNARLARQALRRRRGRGAGPRHPGRPPTPTRPTAPPEAGPETPGGPPNPKKKKFKGAPPPPPNPAKAAEQFASAVAKPAAKPAQTYEVASAASEPAPIPAGYEVASATSKPEGAPRTASAVARANVSANDVINERGYWQGLP